MKRNATQGALLSAVLVAASVPIAGACKQSSSSSPAASPAETGAATSAPATGANPTGATPAPGAAAPNTPPSPPPSASPADPRDAPLAAFARDIGQAVLHAVKGEPVDPRWVSHDAAHSVTVLTDEARRAMGVLGNAPTIVLTELEIDGVAQPSPSEHHQVMTHIVLLPDNTIRWGTVASRQDTGQLVEPTPGLETSAPALATGAARAMTALAANCSLPWLAESDITAVPPALRREFVTDMNPTHAACTQAQGVHGEWRAHADDIRVLVQGNGHFGFLNSVFDVEGSGSVDAAGSRVVLSQVHIELVPEAGH